MVHDPRDPKIIQAEAADKLADLMALFSIIDHPGGDAIRGRIIGMFASRWADLRRASHQLHDAIEANRTDVNRVGMEKLTDPGCTHTVSAGTAGGNTGPREVHEPEYQANDPVIVTEKRLREALQPLYDALTKLEAGPVMKLESGWSDINRQLVGIRARAKDEENEGKGRDLRLDGLEQRLDEHLTRHAVAGHPTITDLALKVDAMRDALHGTDHEGENVKRRLSALETCNLKRSDEINEIERVVDLLAERTSVRGVSNSIKPGDRVCKVTERVEGVVYATYRLPHDLWQVGGDDGCRAVVLMDKPHGYQEVCRFDQLMVKRG